MERLNMHSPDLTQGNIEKIRTLFPNCVTEAKDKHGKLKYAVDFDLLRQELSDSIVEGPQERYQLNWPGKREALLAANAPIAKTLRPCREDSVNFDTTQNLFIEGDNLEAIKLLQESYLGKVDIIYIDPPYNTGNDFIYKDDFSIDASDFKLKSNQEDSASNRLITNVESNGRFHSYWLSMIYSRLKLSRNLLSEDGLIIIHIDENEYPNLEKILSEIFGESNNLGTIVWDKRNPKGDTTSIAQQHELVSIYCKNKASFQQSRQLLRAKENASLMLKKVADLISAEGKVNATVRLKYKEWLAKQELSGGEKAYSLIDDEGEIYQPVSMAWPNKKKAPEDYFLALEHPVTKRPCPVPERGWRNPSSTMKSLLEKGLIVFGEDETIQPRRKYLLKENIYENVPSLLYFGGSDDALISKLGLSFDNPKPLAVATKLIQAAGKKVDTVMDLFAGSGTTAHAVMQLNSEDGGNRRFILVQLPETCPPGSDAVNLGFATITEISKTRIERAGEKIIASQCHKDWNKDVGFRYLKIDRSNMADVNYNPDAVDQNSLDLFVDNIKPDRTGEDLLFQVMLDWGVDLGLPIERVTVQGKEVFKVNGNALVACFDASGGVDEALVKELATLEPLRVVFRDAGFKDSATKINVEQLFRSLSPSTEVKCL